MWGFFQFLFGTLSKKKHAKNQRYGHFKFKFLHTKLSYCWILQLGSSDEYATCEISNFFIFTFSSTGNLKFCTRSHSNSFYLRFRWKGLQTDDVTFQHSIEPGSATAYETNIFERYTVPLLERYSAKLSRPCCASEDSYGNP